MRQFNAYNFYLVGMSLHPIGEWTEPKKVRVVWHPIFTAKQWLVTLYRDDIVPLSPVSKSAADSLYAVMSGIIPDDLSLIDDFEAEIAPWSLASLRTAVSNFETVFSTDLQVSANTFCVAQKGIYNTADLISRCELALGDSINVFDDDQVRKDFNQAGRCVAFELPTAAALHLTRAIEAALRQYHQLVCTTSLTAGKKPEMATCINELRAIGEDAKTMDILDHFRHLHRNTTMHSEAFLELDEALRLFDIAKSAVHSIADRMALLNLAWPLQRRLLKPALLRRSRPPVLRRPSSLEPRCIHLIPRSATLNSSRLLKQNPKPLR